MNTFDVVVIAVAFVGVVMGFASGLLRSLGAILAYLIAGGLAIGRDQPVEHDDDQRGDQKKGAAKAAA